MYSWSLSIILLGREPGGDDTANARAVRAETPEPSSSIVVSAVRRPCLENGFVGQRRCVRRCGVRRQRTVYRRSSSVLFWQV